MSSIDRQFILFPDMEPPDAATPRALLSPDSATSSAVGSARYQLRMCVLGSGSGGNCSAVALGDRIVLVDLGFGPTTTTRRLMQARASLEQVACVCLTHLDRDHFRPNWVPTLLGWGIRVLLHRWHLGEFREIEGTGALLDAGLVTTFADDTFEPVSGLHVTPVRLAHDTQGTSGFHLASACGSIGYATDLGHVPDVMVERFAGVDILAIESNYDPPMQLRSPRPAFLKRRIMGPAGHLSNQQSFDAVRRIVDRSPLGRPEHVVLLHRSQQCNDPQVVRQVFQQDARIAPRITLTEQRRRSRWFTAKRIDASRQSQLHLAF